MAERTRPIRIEFCVTEQERQLMLCIIKAVMRMNLIITTILQEKDRIDRMLKKYQEELEKLPKGTISEKKVRQSTYFYLKYRDGKKVISQYVSQKDVGDVRKQVEKRRHIETMIRSLKEERAIAEQALEGHI